MITILCSPKPFINEAAWNQINALRSWRAIGQNIEIIVFGAVQGASEAAAEVNADFVPEIETSSTGAPSFNFMANYASERSRNNLLVYVNCDILLNSSIVKAMESASNRFNRFLLVGERLDLAQGIIINVCQPNWAENLTSLAGKKQLLPHGPTGVDYFGFIRNMWDDLPPVYMGRAMCDQALLHYCLGQRIPVLDASLAVTAVHQFHDYSHIQGGKQEVFRGKDLADMKRIHKLGRSLPTVPDADWSFNGKGIIAEGRLRRLRKEELILRYRYRLSTLAMVLRALQYLGGGKNLQPSPHAIKMILESWNYFVDDH
jgi:hypothetical protein